MTIHTTDAEAQARLLELLDEVGGSQETARITRAGKPDVVLVDAAELDNLREHLHVLTPLENAVALAAALERAARGEGLRLTAEQLHALAEQAGRTPQRMAEVLAELHRRGKQGHPSEASRRWGRRSRC